MPEPSPSADAEIRAAQQANFDELAARLASTAIGRRVRFLNFGYAALPGEVDPAPDLPPSALNRESIRLVRAVLGEVELGGTVLEVGCGRGGNLQQVATAHDGVRAVGVDLSGGSLSGLAGTGIAAIQGDAQRLPVRTGGADHVVSIESACTYPDVEAFYREVGRVLAPGGWFLYADIVDAAVEVELSSLLGGLGLEVVDARDITPNVLAARAASSRAQLRSLDERGAGWGEYVATEGSFLHDALAGGGSRYVLRRCRRSADPAAPTDGPGLGPDLASRSRAFAAACADALAGVRS